MNEQAINPLIEVIAGIPYVGEYIPLLGTLILAAKSVTPWINTKGKNKWLNAVRYALNFLAMNFGKDRNADDPKESKNKKVEMV